MRPKKHLGQNFLTRDHYARVMCEAAHVSQKDTVIEIGPGKGILTNVLLEMGAMVLAVEKDSELIPGLREKFKEEIKEGRLKIIEEDIRALDTEESVFPKKYKLVANIPYYITGEILRLFLSTPHQPESMALLVQKEVAERIIARDGKESLLSISVKVYGEPKIVTRVSAGNFFPKPKVDSAILHIENISKKFFKDFSEEKFFEILHAGFAHKRKQLLGNLEKYGKEKIALILQKQNLPPTVRAEDLSFGDWKEITKKS